MMSLMHLKLVSDKGIIVCSWHIWIPNIKYIILRDQIEIWDLWVRSLRQFDCTDWSVIGSETGLRVIKRTW